MSLISSSRRRFCALSAALTASARTQAGTAAPLVLFTFGDSVLDCGRYNEYGVHPGQLLLRNSDALFPEFKGQDLLARGPARLRCRASSGVSLPARCPPSEFWMAEIGI